MFLTTMLAAITLGQVSLSGSRMGIEEAQAKSREIVVATSGIDGFIAGSGPHSFGGLKLVVASTLKGEAVKGESRRVSVAASGPETLPVWGDEYIFFIGDYKGSPRIVKVLPKTAENLSAVKKQVSMSAHP